MTVIACHRERIKIEMLLDQGSDQLFHLQALSAAELEQLREQISTVMFDSHAGLFERLAGAGRLMPLKLQTVVAEKALGPMLCARVAAYSPVERALNMAERLQIPFLADVAARMDPTRAGPLLEGLSVKRAQAVADELARRDDVITLGRFVDAMPVASTQAVMEHLEDDAILLRSAFFVSNTTQLDAVVGLLSEERLTRITRTAVEQALYIEALALMQAVRPELATRLAGLGAAQPGLFEGLVQCCQDNGLWADASPLINRMSQDARTALLAVPLMQQDAVVDSLLHSFQHHDRQPALADWSADMPLPLREQFAQRASVLGVTLPDTL